MQNPITPATKKNKSIDLFGIFVSFGRLAMVGEASVSVIWNHMH
jgi:hypothetical protein